MSLFDIRQAVYDKNTTLMEYFIKLRNEHVKLYEYALFIQTTELRSIHIEGGQVVYTLNNDIRMVCDYRDLRAAPFEVMSMGAYEKKELEMCRQLLQDGQTFIDVGANIGWYSLQLARLFPAATVLAIEPIPATFEYLKQNIHLNGLTNIQSFNCGCWKEMDTLTFSYYPEQSGNASILNVSGYEGAQPIKCLVVKLDDFAKQRGLHPDFIKIDVEGAELRVLEGAGKILKRDQPIILAESVKEWAEKFDYTPADLLAYLGGYGYRCFVTCYEDRRLHEPDDNKRETNFFFLHGDKHKELIERMCA